MIVIGMKIMDNSKARQVGRERTPEGSHLGKFTQYSPGWYSSPPTHKTTHLIQQEENQHKRSAAPQRRYCCEEARS